MRRGWWRPPRSAPAPSPPTPRRTRSAWRPRRATARTSSDARHLRREAEDAAEQELAAARAERERLLAEARSDAAAQAERDRAQAEAELAAYVERRRREADRLVERRRSGQ